jgi:hypothetical protein
LLDLALAGFSLFRSVKEALADITLDQKSIKNAWEGVTRTIAPKDYTTAFRRWFELCKKCMGIGGNFIGKY